MMTMRNLGKKGRFANQLFQYAYLRQESGGEFQCPAWIGQSIFGLNDPLPTKGTSELTYRFPLNSSYYDKKLFRKLFIPNLELKKILDSEIDQYKKNGTLVGIHLRRGDYGTFRRKSARWCFVAPTQWYLDWLKEHRIKNPIIFIASEEAENLHGEFANDYPAFFWKGRNFYWDFYTLSKCKYILISNSTFGFAASMLSSAKCWRPRLSLKKLIPYDPWNAPLVLKDERY